MPTAHKAPKRSQPGPGRETADVAFADLKDQISKSNEAAHARARRQRRVEEDAATAKRRASDLL